MIPAGPLSCKLEGKPYIHPVGEVLGTLNQLAKRGVKSPLPQFHAPDFKPLRRLSMFERSMFDGVRFFLATGRVFSLSSQAEFVLKEQFMPGLLPFTSLLGKESLPTPLGMGSWSFSFPPKTYA
jgi:hypothetical protein